MVRQITLHEIEVTSHTYSKKALVEVGYIHHNIQSSDHQHRYCSRYYCPYMKDWKRSNITPIFKKGKWSASNCQLRLIESAMQLRSLWRCGKTKNVVIQTVKMIPSSNLRPRWRTMEVGGGIPQNESEAVEYLQKRCIFLALSEVLFSKII